MNEIKIGLFSSLFLFQSSLTCLLGLGASHSQEEVANATEQAERLGSENQRGVENMAQASIPIPPNDQNGASTSFSPHTSFPRLQSLGAESTSEIRIQESMLEEILADVHTSRDSNNETVQDKLKAHCQKLKIPDFNSVRIKPLNDAIDGVEINQIATHKVDEENNLIILINAATLVKPDNKDIVATLVIQETLEASAERFYKEHQNIRPPANQDDLDEIKIYCARIQGATLLGLQRGFKKNFDDLLEYVHEKNEEYQSNPHVAQNIKEASQNYLNALQKIKDNEEILDNIDNSQNTLLWEVIKSVSEAKELAAEIDDSIHGMLKAAYSA